MFEIRWRQADSRRHRSVTAATVAALAAILALAVSVTAETDDVSSAGCYCVGTVGNVNCDYRDDVTLADVAMLIDHLYVTGVRLPNRDEANADGDAEGHIGLGDINMLVHHLFIDGVELPDCPSPYNTPPETQIVGFVQGVPFINSVEPYSPATGARLQWEASDIVDHPYGDPDFEYEYRVYGPYTDSLFGIVTDSFIVQIFRTNDGRMFRYDQEPPEFFVPCDTFWLPGGVPDIVCDTVLIDTLELANEYGFLDTLFDFGNPEFTGNPDLNRLALISDDGGDAWITLDHDSLYNLYAAYPSDTTLDMSFLFAVRSRETLAPEAVDPTPAFVSFDALDPKHERDILVMNWTVNGSENRELVDSVALYWERAVDSWIVNKGLEGVVVFDPERDFADVDPYAERNRMLGLALQYKTMVQVQDASAYGVWSSQGEPVRNTMLAMQLGVNVWAAARVPLGGYYVFASSAGTFQASDAYAYFFGVDRYYFPGWGSHILDYYDGYGYGLPRVEDFIGANPQFPSTWPALAVDTAALHHRYHWEGSIDPLDFPFMPFLPDPGALPQVGWCQPIDGVEILYRYVSLYGEEEHPYEPARDFHGKPVMHRLERDLFRSVHSNFTPLALEETAGQQLVDSVLNWLYERWLPEPVSDNPTGIVGASNEGGAR